MVAVERGRAPEDAEGFVLFQPARGLRRRKTSRLLVDTAVALRRLLLGMDSDPWLAR